jgi:[acyl-carrier-protein] S-malonyltransferase
MCADERCRLRIAGLYKYWLPAQAKWLIAASLDKVEQLPSSDSHKNAINQERCTMASAHTGQAFVCPGQGSQSVGMGHALYSEFAEAREVFDAVDDALGEKLSALMFNGPEDALTLTRNAQPGLMAVSVAVVRVLEARSGRSLATMADYVAGHSLGEYSALAAAGALDVGAAARLLRLRGEAMQTAVPVGEGAMAAILGLSLAAVQTVAADAARDSGAVCDVANDNAEGQVVVSGARAAVERAVALAKESGAKRSILLPVSAPFHCALMAPAAETMAAALAAAELQAPSVPVIANVAAAPISNPDDIRSSLVAQVTGMVRWRESILWMAQNGINKVVEVGSGKVLSGMNKRIEKSLGSAALSDPETITAFIAELDC